jgi:hypothetical protein
VRGKFFCLAEELLASQEVIILETNALWDCVGGGVGGGDGVGGQFKLYTQLLVNCKW